MSSFKKLAKSARDEYTFFINEEGNKLVPALFEIAHALSRGRKPTSCSQLPGVNIQGWLRQMYYEVQDHIRDHMGDKCPYVDELIDNLQYWMFDDPVSSKKVLQAIKICRKYIKPRAKPSKYRGDYDYQRTHKSTNLKRKREWLRRKQGSCFDDFEWRDSDYCVNSGL
jgi:hypothetical protein